MSCPGQNIAQSKGLTFVAYSTLRHDDASKLRLKSRSTKMLRRFVLRKYQVSQSECGHNGGGYVQMLNEGIAGEYRTTLLSLDMFYISSDGVVALLTAFTIYPFSHPRCAGTQS